MEASYKTIVCSDLRSFDNTLPDYGAQAYFDLLGFQPGTICFLSFYTQFLADFTAVDDTPLDPMCTGQAGTPSRQEWTHRQLKGLIDALSARGTRAVLGILAATTSPVFGNTRFVWPWPEILQTLRGGKRTWGEAINPLKRFEDGSWFEDWFAARLAVALEAFGFSGFVAGDGMLGLRGPRETLRDTDFSEDMVAQFVAHSGIELPHLAGYDARADYITENCYAEWVDFWVWRWCGFAHKLSGVLRAQGRSFMAIDAWSRAPEESVYSFGVDYRLLCDNGLEGLFVQAREPNKWRKHREGEYVREQDAVYTFLAHKAYEPRLEYYWAQATVNYPEFWNAVLDLPGVVERESYAYLWCAHLSPAGPAPVCAGLCIIWGNDLSAENWRWLKARWDQAYALLGSYTRPAGPVLVYAGSETALRGPEAARRHSRFARLLDAGLPVQASVSLADICTGGEALRTCLAGRQLVYLGPQQELGQLPAWARVACVTEEGILLEGRCLPWEQGLARLRAGCGAAVNTGRLLGFEAADGGYTLSVENPANLFYQHTWLAADRHIRQVEVLPPRQWYAIPGGTAGGTAVVSVPPDASVQLRLITQGKRIPLKFIEKEMGI